MKWSVWIVWLTMACAAPQRYQFDEVAMGTTFRLVFYAQGADSARAAAEAAFARIHALDRTLSDYRRDSELSRLSRASDDGPSGVIQVSRDLGRVLVASSEVSLATEGAFDVTVGPYVRLWRRGARRGELPDPGALREAGASVGWSRVNALEGPGGFSVELGSAGMRIDLGGIAKGYALDEALLVLAEHGIVRALVDGGGDLVASRPPPGSQGWVVGLDIGEGPVAAVLLSNGACATSGDAYRHVDIGGVRYSHVVDPRSGMGLRRQQAATVLAPTGMLADSWASALCVLSPSTGLGLLARHRGLEARIWQKGDGVPCDSEGFLARMSPPNPNEQPRPQL